MHEFPMPKYPEMRTEWLTTTSLSLALIWIISALLLIFTFYVIARMWREWSWQSRIVGCGGVFVIIALGILVANEMSDESFRSHFVSDYAAAVGLFVIAFF